MFNDNITQTYNFQDASQEIIIMLLGAFLLGGLITWLLNKLFNKDYGNEGVYRYGDIHNDDIYSLNKTPTLQAETTGDVRIINKASTPTAKTITADDLTKISGIDKRMQNQLKAIGIESFADLRDIRTNDLTNFQEKQKTYKREIETWPHQANLAAKGDWDKLENYQRFIQRVQVASNNASKPDNSDDLTQLVGIDSNIEYILNKKEILTFSQLSELDTDTLRTHLVDADVRLAKTETESWPHQAAMAEKGQWEELKIYQEFMHSDSEVLAKHTDKASKLTSNKKHFEEEPDQNLNDHDDLKRIEGIGPKIEEVLNNSGIYTFSQLYNSDKNRLRMLLDDAGSQFRMHDPESWPHQAGMADRSEWDDLKAYQNSINNGKSSLHVKVATSKTETKSKPKKKNKLTLAHQKDDLKKIEGIGPKIQELLNNDNIYSFKELSKSSQEHIKMLLTQAGPQFRMHDPESWPHQAKLAAKGEWKELEEYQEFLISSRKKTT